jgi:predicted secreted protein
MTNTNPTAGQKAIIQVFNSTLTTMTGLKTAEISIGVDIYDITDLNSNNWKIKLAGLADYTMKLGGNFDLSDAQQAMLQADAITTPGATLQWAIWPQGTGGSNKAYRGTCIIKTQDVKFDVKAEEQVSWDLEGNGAITYS